MNAAPVEPIDRLRDLRERHPHDVVLHGRPVELPVPHPLASENRPAAVPDERFDAVCPIGAEDEDSAGVGRD